MRCECDQNIWKFSKKVFIIKKEKEKKLGSKSFLHLCKDINLYKVHSRSEPWQIPKPICIQANHRFHKPILIKLSVPGPNCLSSVYLSEQENLC